MASAEEVDLLVVGSGCAGLTAALMATVDGYRVKVVEKTEHVGGTTAYSSGTAWIPATRLASAAGFDDSPEKAASYLDWMTRTDEGQAQRSAFLESGADAIDFLHQKTGIRFILPPHAPDYRVGPGSVEGGRAMVAQEFDARQLGADFALVRPPRPGFDLLGGMMVNRADINALMAPFSSLAAFKHGVGLLLRHAADRLRHPRGTRWVMGNALVGKLLLELRQRQVPLQVRTQAVRLLREDGRVVGAVLRGADGQEIEQRARVGVVLATGGWSASSEWRQRLLPAGDCGYSVAAPGNGGDGLRLGVEAGGEVATRDHRSGAFWMPTSIQREPDGRQVLFPHIVMDRAKPGLIAVNRRGERFVNEAGSYHDFVCAMLAHPEMGPSQPAWLVVDASFLWTYGLGLVKPWQLSVRRYLDSGYLVRANTLEELAARIEVDAQGLVQTVARHNGYAQTGQDLEFGRGSTPLNRQNGDPRVRPNPCLAPIARAPFYALAVWPADLATSAGLRTDGDGRVLARDLQPIDGLYAIGNDMASIMQGTYPGPGTTLGPAIVFAYRATRHMLRAAPPKEEQ